MSWLSLLARATHSHTLSLFLTHRYPHAYTLDDHHVFEKDRPVLVCGNSASMVGESWLAPHFRIEGERSHHFGLFGACSPDANGAEAKDSSSASSLGCC